MRTTLLLDDNLLRRAQQLTGLRSKRAVIDLALRTLVRLQEQSAVRELRGKLIWEGDLNDLRQNRQPPES